MPGDGKVLLVLEGASLREEPIRLALELAKRLGCPVDALLLVDGYGAIGADAADDLLASVAGAATEEGVRVTRAAKTGDPGSELLKHLAAHGPARVLVWGGDSSALRSSRHARKGHHWFVRVREQVHCPVVIATGRARGSQATGAAGQHTSRARKT